MFRSSKNSIFAKNGDGLVLHCNDTTLDSLLDAHYICVDCQSSLSRVEKQGDNGHVFLHKEGESCNSEGKEGFLQYAKQVFSSLRSVRIPDIKVTLDAVTHMIPGFVNRFYELPAEIFSYPSKYLTFSDVQVKHASESSSVGLRITGVDDYRDFGFYVNVGHEQLNAFELDGAGRLPIFSIDCDFDNDDVCLYSMADLESYLLKEAPRQWLTHPPFFDELVKKRQERFYISAQRAGDQGNHRNELHKQGVVEFTSQSTSNEVAFLEQYHEYLECLSRYRDVSVDAEVLKRQIRDISKGTMHSMTYFAEQAKSFPDGIPLPYGRAHILALYAARKIDLTLSRVDPYADCYVIAAWLVEEFSIPRPLSSFIQRPLFYCLDITHWRSSKGLNDSYEQRELLLAAKRLLIFMWELVNFRPNQPVKRPPSSIDG